MKICIYGAGAVGGHLAVRLARAGHTVSVIARGATLAAIRSNGLTLHTRDGPLQARVLASEHAAELGAQDLVFVTLKAHALDAFAHGSAPLIGAATQIVFVQNGIPWWYELGNTGEGAARPDLSFLDPGGVIGASVPHARCHGAVITSGNTVTAPGVIDNSTPVNTLLIAPITSAAEAGEAAAAAVRALCVAAGLVAPPVADLRREIWRKLVANIVTGMTVLTGRATAETLQDAEVYQTAQRLADEVVAIAATQGITLTATVPTSPPGKKASLLQDFEKGQAMEVDAQFIAPLAFARAAGLDVPVLETVTRLIAFHARRLAAR